MSAIPGVKTSQLEDITPGRERLLLRCGPCNRKLPKLLMTQSLFLNQGTQWLFQQPGFTGGGRGEEFIATPLKLFTAMCFCVSWSRNVIREVNPPYLKYNRPYRGTRGSTSSCGTCLVHLRLRHPPLAHGPPAPRAWQPDPPFTFTPSMLFPYIVCLAPFFLTVRFPIKCHQTRQAFSVHLLPRLSTSIRLHPFILLGFYHREPSPPCMGNYYLFHCF